MTTFTPVPSYTGPVYYARSDRHANHFYAVGVNAATGLYACECPDHQHRQRDCKHIRRVQAGQVPAAQSKRPSRPVRSFSLDTLAAVASLDV